MGLLNATRSCPRNYAAFSGRSRRPESRWPAALYGLLILICAEGLPRVLTLAELRAGVVLNTAILSMLATVLVLTPPLFAAAARRLHDVEMSSLAVMIDRGFGPLAGGEACGARVGGSRRLRRRGAA